MSRGRHALQPGGDGETRAARARSEQMAVVPAGDGSYDVVTAENRVYTVDLEERRCTCPDARIRDVHCKHLLRVTMEVAEGLVPAPDQRAAGCADCGEETYVSRGAPDPVYCATCTLEPGEYAIDRERGDLVVVARTTDRRADETPLPGETDHTVATYPGNEAYPDRDAVVEVCYPLPAGLSPAGVEKRRIRRYAFPRGRLRRLGDPGEVRRN